MRLVNFFDIFTGKLNVEALIYNEAGIYIKHTKIWIRHHFRLPIVGGGCPTSRLSLGWSTILEKIRPTTLKKFWQTGNGHHTSWRGKEREKNDVGLQDPVFNEHLHRHHHRIPRAWNILSLQDCSHKNDMHSSIRTSNKHHSRFYRKRNHYLHWHGDSCSCFKRNNSVNRQESTQATFKTHSW